MNTPTVTLSGHGTMSSLTAEDRATLYSIGQDTIQSFVSLAVETVLYSELQLGPLPHD